MPGNDLFEIAWRSAWYPRREEEYVFEPVRFIWNATRGYRLRPWRSPYLRWRVETFSGKKAETLTLASIVGFLWETKGELLRFLQWTGSVQREARKRQ
jgi:hypothetical protein